MGRVHAALAVLAAMVALPVSAADRVATSAFARIAERAGCWLAIDPEHAGTVVCLRVIAGGTAVVETWTTRSDKTSMTVFHRDGERLMATHYCPQGNQPRLAANDRLTGDDISLTMQDITDVAAGESFQHDLVVHLGVMDRLSQTETYWTPEGPDTSTIELVRQPVA